MTAGLAGTARRASAEKELRGYFADRLRSFLARCDVGSLPAFTQAVLQLTARIPYGEIRN